MWKVPRLRKELKGMRLNTTGKKNELIEKIMGSDGVDRVNIVTEWKIVCASQKEIRKTKRKRNSEDDGNESAMETESV